MNVLNRPTAFVAAALVACGAAAPAIATAAPAPAPAGNAATRLLKPPSGSQQLKAAVVKGITYRRYKISGQTPKQVSTFYVQAWKNAGYTVHSGGGGGGWGPWGGSGAGAQGHKGGHYLSVNAGARTSGPTYFEVCFGDNQKLVNDCQNLLQNN